MASSATLAAALPALALTFKARAKAPCGVIGEADVGLDTTGFSAVPPGIAQRLDGRVDVALTCAP